VEAHVNTEQRAGGTSVAGGPGRAILSAVFLCAGLLACQWTPNPVTGHPEWVLMDAAKEREVSDEGALQIEAGMGIARDAERQAWLRAVGDRLAKHSPRRGVEYRFFIVEMDEPNAFALPDGRIYLSRGVLVLVNSEAELANVLAHEIGHVAARHHAQRDAHQKTFGLSTLAGRVAGGGKQEEGEFIGGVDGAFAYGRNQERQADVIGMEIAGAAGYDPAGMGDFMRSLDRSMRLLHGYSMQRSYFATHPATPERVAENHARAEIERHAKAPLARRSSTSLRQHLDGMPAERPASEGVFVGNRFLHADMGFSLRFPVGWEPLNRSSAVAAISKKRDAIAMLQVAGEDVTPEEAARAQAEEHGFGLDAGRALRIGGREGLPAFRAEVVIETPFGSVIGTATWVGLGKQVYRLLCGVERGRPARVAGVCRSFSRSLRALSDAERAEISELRLRFLEALEGETLSALVRRSGTEWSLNRIAVINGLQVDDVLSAGRFVKVVMREPDAGAARGAGL
jgi:predicted Zn-dependent protease